MLPGDSLVNCGSNKLLQASVTVMNYPVLLSLSASELTSVQMKIGEVTAWDKIKIVYLLFELFSYRSAQAYCTCKLVQNH